MGILVIAIGAIPVFYNIKNDKTLTRHGQIMIGLILLYFCLYIPKTWNGHNDKKKSDETQASTLKEVKKANDLSKETDFSVKKADDNITERYNQTVVKFESLTEKITEASSKTERLIKNRKDALNRLLVLIETN